MNARADRELRLNGLSLALRERNLVMGILNVTPDSFSDGGRYLDKGAALDRARIMIEEGADLLDIGGESTRPGAEPAPPEEQIARILPVIESLRAESDIPISVDTQSAQVAAVAFQAGADIANDISALESSPRLGEVVASRGAGLILMHKRGTPKTMQAATAYDDLVGEVKDYLKDRIEVAREIGVDGGRIWIDPGIGFGKSDEGNLELVVRMAEFDSLVCPIVVGASRKSFLGKYLQRKVEDRLAGTIAITCLVAVSGPSRVHRVHDVKEARDALRMTEATREMAVHG